MHYDKPTEWVWRNVKHDRIGKAGVASKFADPSLRYIAAVA